MDKNEYRAKLDEINDLVDRQDYRGALKIVDTIDWRRVRSARTPETSFDGSSQSAYWKNGIVPAGGAVC